MSKPKAVGLRDALGGLALAGCLALLVFLGINAVRGTIRPGESMVPAPLATRTPHLTAKPAQAGVNLNTATLEELMALPGIGETLAEAVIKQRTIHPFHFLEDLRMVNGFGDKRIEELRGLAYVEPPEEP